MTEMQFEGHYMLNKKLGWKMFDLRILTTLVKKFKQAHRKVSERMNKFVRKKTLECT